MPLIHHPSLALAAPPNTGRSVNRKKEIFILLSLVWKSVGESAGQPNEPQMIKSSRRALIHNHFFSF